MKSTNESKFLFIAVQSEISILKSFFHYFQNCFQSSDQNQNQNLT